MAKGRDKQGRAGATNSPDPRTGVAPETKNVPAKESELLATILDDMF